MAAREGGQVFLSEVIKKTNFLPFVRKMQYLCRRENDEATNQLMVAIGSIRANAAVVVAAYSRLRTDC